MHMVKNIQVTHNCIRISFSVSIHRLNAIFVVIILFLIDFSLVCFFFADISFQLEYVVVYPLDPVKKSTILLLFYSAETIIG